MEAETATMIVRKELVIERSQEDTFRLFTEELGAWWPTMTHSIYGEDVAEAVLEPGMDGRIYERTADGRTAEWGKIVEWDAPRSFAVSWKPNLDDLAHRTQWRVHFEVVDDERTRLTLIHSGWEGFGDTAEEARSMYDTGWDHVLARYVDAI